MDLGRQAVGVLAGLLALAVLLVVGNTIRLGIHNHHDAIVIASLFGATHAFIRRPFLHSGYLYGLGGRSWLGSSSRLPLLYWTSRCASSPRFIPAILSCTGLALASSLYSCSVALGLDS